MSKHIIKRGWYDFKAGHKASDQLTRKAFFEGAALVLKTVYNAAKKEEGFIDDFEDMARDLASEKP